MRRLLMCLALGIFGFSSVQASPDVDFPQPGQSYGGKVRNGPGMQYRQTGSLREGDGILILNGTGAMMDGYEWFEIRYGNGRTGYQWGGLICSQTSYPTIVSVCRPQRPSAWQHNQNTRPNAQRHQPPARQQAHNPAPPRPGPSRAVTKGFDVTQVMHRDGSFRFAGGRRWQERDRNGRVTFTFREQNRDEWSVYLFDASRGVHLQLDLHRQTVLYRRGNERQRVIYNITGSAAGR